MKLDDSTKLSIVHVLASLDAIPNFISFISFY